MGLEQRPQAKYSTIGKDSGKIRHKDGETEVLYDSLVAKLYKIELREETYKGNTFNRYHFHLKDGDKLFILQSSETSAFSRSLINALANIDYNRKIRIAPYQKTYEDRTYAVPYVEQSGESVSWRVPPEEIPDVEYVNVGGKQVANDSARNKFYKAMASRINELVEEAGFSPDISEENGSAGPATSTDDNGGLSEAADDRQDLAEPLYSDDDLPF